MKRTSLAWNTGTTLASLWLVACGAERKHPGYLLDGGTVADPFGSDSGAKTGTQGPAGGALGLADGGGQAGGGGGDVCADFPIPAYTQTPEVLIVVDRSGSMLTLTVDRWHPSVAAVNAVVSQLEPAVHFGLMTFPGDCTTLPTADQQLACLANLGAPDQSLSCQVGRVDVPIGATNSADISAALSKTTPTGATPTAASITAAATALIDLPTAPTDGSRSILLVTDGAPNCSLGVGGLLAVGVGSGSGQPEAVTQTVSSILAADKAGVRTYVIGYQTDSDPSLGGALDMMAAAGGTGVKTHFKVEDQQSLLDALSTLSKTALLCEVHLAQPVTDVSLLRVTVAGQDLASDAVDGYTLSTDQQTVTLHGTSCTTVQANPTAGLAHVQILCPPPPVSDAGTPGGGGPGTPEDAGGGGEPDAGDDEPPEVIGI